MPIEKRVIYGTKIYGQCFHPDILDDHLQLLQNVDTQEHQTEENREIIVEEAKCDFRLGSSFSNILGALHQISCISIVANDIFKGLTILASDSQERIRRLSNRTSQLISSSQKIGSHTKFYDYGVNNQSSFVPSLFLKNSNCAGLSAQYSLCKSVPQFWRIEAFLPADTESPYRNYSFPGFFFDSWVKEELQRQEISRAQRKADKKDNRLEKKKLRTQEAVLRKVGKGSVKVEEEETKNKKQSAEKGKVGSFRRSQNPASSDDEDARAQKAHVVEVSCTDKLSLKYSCRSSLLQLGITKSR